MTKKQIIRTVSFFLVLFFGVVLLCDLFALDNNATHNQRYSTFNSLNEDTVDAVMIGTSGIDRYWCSAKAYEDYGMTVYPLSYDSCPSWLVLDIMKEAMVRQNPKLFIIDVRVFVHDNHSYKNADSRARKVLDSMPFFSINRLSGAIRTMKAVNRIDKSAAPALDLSYIFSFIKYHGRWKEEGYSFKNSLGQVTNRLMGFYMWNEVVIKREPIAPVGYDADYKEPLQEISSDALYEIIEYSKKHNIDIMFLDTPQTKLKLGEGRGNTIYDILDSEKIPYVHYFTESTESGISQELNLDLNKDFYNRSHVNYYGAIKFTDVFAKYLNENYDFPDRREDEKAKEDWDGCFAGIVNIIKTLESKNADN